MVGSTIAPRSRHGTEGAPLPANPCVGERPAAPARCFEPLPWSACPALRPDVFCCGSPDVPLILPRTVVRTTALVIVGTGTIGPCPIGAGTIGSGSTGAGTTGAGTGLVTTGIRTTGRNATGAGAAGARAALTTGAGTTGVRTIVNRPTATRSTGELVIGAAGVARRMGRGAGATGVRAFFATAPRLATTTTGGLAAVPACGVGAGALVGGRMAPRLPRPGSPIA